MLFPISLPAFFPLWPLCYIFFHSIAINLPGRETAGDGCTSPPFFLAPPVIRAQGGFALARLGYRIHSLSLTPSLITITERVNHPFPPLRVAMYSFP